MSEMITLSLLNSDVMKADFSNVPPINLVITSPPYNVGIKYDEHDDTMTYPEYLKWCGEWLKLMYDHMPNDGRLCVNLPFTINPEHLNDERDLESVDNHIHYPLVADCTNICVSLGFKYWRTVLWDKPISMKTCWGSWRSASAPFMRDPSEAILIFYKNQWKRKTKGESTITKEEFMSWTKSTWKMQPETKSEHPAAFPLELPLRCIKLFSYVNDVICDPFMGSGTSGEATVRMRRNFIGVEKSEKYFQMAKERIEASNSQASVIENVMPNLMATDPKELW